MVTLFATANSFYVYIIIETQQRVSLKLKSFSSSSAPSPFKASMNEFFIETFTFQNKLKFPSYVTFQVA